MLDDLVSQPKTSNIRRVFEVLDGVKLRDR